ncbi:MAG TPA: hypothetical protein VFQ20_04490 [Burkholderiaceae bacterium]|nr:hypothetical protein [Burkholderiaceae bacterium]
MWAFDGRREVVAAVKVTPNGPALAVQQRLRSGPWQPLAPDHVLTPYQGLAAVATARGEVVAAWIDPVRQTVHATKYASATGWTTPVELESPTIGVVWRPLMAADAAGRVYVAWMRTEGDSTATPARLWVTTSAAASGWDPARTLGTTGVGNFMIAGDRVGDGASLVWYDQDASLDAVVHFAEWRPGTGWSAPRTIEALASNGIRRPNFLSYAVSRRNGASVFAYGVGERIPGTDPQAYRQALHAVRCSAGATCEPALVVNGAGNAGLISADLNRNGAAMVAWQEYTHTLGGGGFAGLFSSRLGSGAATTPTLVTSLLNGEVPRLRAELDERWVAAWIGISGNRARPYAARFDGAGPWGLPQPVTDVTVDNASQLHLAIGATGGAVFAWIEPAIGSASLGTLVLADLPP